MKQLDEYQKLIDSLVRLKPSVLALWCREKTDWSNTPENQKIGDLLASLSPEQRVVVSGLVQGGRDEGIHDVLAFINDEILRGRLRLVVNGEPLPIEPFGTEMNYDWVARAAGDEWPEPRENS